MTTEYLGPYQGRDMAGYLMEMGFRLCDADGAIVSMTNVRDTAIIVAEYGIYRARPEYRTGICVERVAVI
jgi:hypothetical protein